MRGRLSLSDRFGLWIGFHSIDQDTYLEMIDEYVKPSMTWVYIILSFMWILGYLLIIFTTCKLFNDQQQKEKREQQIAQSHV